VEAHRVFLCRLLVLVMVAPEELDIGDVVLNLGGLCLRLLDERLDFLVLELVDFGIGALFSQRDDPAC
jgi:hypothetical protein